MNTPSIARPGLGTLPLYLTVFITGAAVMIIELLGTRLIAPFYGASLYVWSSLISVTMISLAIGYFSGGCLADRSDGRGLSLIVAVSALLTLAIPGLTRTVLLATDPLGLRLGAFLSALALFGPALTCLGMVGPFAIKSAATSLEGLGTRAGTIYGVSTVGSVVGTLTLGFFLFPRLGSREILIGSSAGLLVWALALAAGEYARFGRSRAVTATAMVLVLAVVALPRVVDAGHVTVSGKYSVRSETESLYGWVRVIDDPAGDLRLLTSDASAIGAASLAYGTNRLGYQHIVTVLPALAPQVRRALLIGQGAGHMATVLHDQHGIVTDTLEIDPAVADAAIRFFDFKPTGQAIVGDGRYEMRRLPGPYDLIILDCFTGGSEPAHLLTLETLRQLKEKLSPDGLLALNFVGFAESGRNPALASVSRTMAEEFPHQSVFIAEPGKDFNDFIFLAAGHPIDIHNAKLSSEQSEFLLTRLMTVDAGQGQLLTDNFNPLEHLQTRKSEHYRRLVVDWLGTDLLVR